MTNKKTTRFSVTLYGWGSMSDTLLKLIATHNGGKDNVTLGELEAYIGTQKKILPLTLERVKVFPSDCKLEIWEGEEPVLLIEENEYYELSDEPEALTQANGFGALADG